MHFNIIPCCASQRFCYTRVFWLRFFIFLLFSMHAAHTVVLILVHFIIPSSSGEENKKSGLLTVASLKSGVSWDVMSCSLVNMHWWRKLACPNTFVRVYQTTRSNIPDDSYHYWWWHAIILPNLWPITIMPCVTTAVNKLSVNKAKVCENLRRLG